MTPDHNPTEWTRYRVRIQYPGAGVVDNRHAYPRTLRAARKNAARMLEERAPSILESPHHPFARRAIAIIETREQRHDCYGEPIRGAAAGRWQELERIEVTA